MAESLCAPAGAFATAKANAPTRRPWQSHTKRGQLTVALHFPHHPAGIPASHCCSGLFGGLRHRIHSSSQYMGTPSPALSIQMNECNAGGIPRYKSHLVFT
uniref:Uncharacterized protein n=1 Tax=Physcomitrium patens TaxID=3218 RepID=A0A2K1K8M3_PHYPA|nr:hypothetical protein PHYPA_012016 [Physcomitrium patens]